MEDCHNRCGYLRKLKGQNVLGCGWIYPETTIASRFVDKQHNHRNEHHYRTSNNHRNRTRTDHLIIATTRAEGPNRTALGVWPGLPAAFECTVGENAIGSPAQMGGRASPSPILRSLHQPRPHGVERHVTQRSRKMTFIRSDGAEPALPKMTGTLAPRLYGSGIASMDTPARGADRLDRTALG